MSQKRASTQGDASVPTRIRVRHQGDASVPTGVRVWYQGDASVPTLLHTTPAPTRTIHLSSVCDGRSCVLLAISYHIGGELSRSHYLFTLLATSFYLG